MQREAFLINNFLRLRSRDVTSFLSLALRLSENAHLPFDVLTALSKAEGLR
jgi:hypothetical protein